MQHNSDRIRAYISELTLTKDTPYLAWGVYCEDLGENWPRYNGTALYVAPG